MCEEGKRDELSMNPPPIRRREKRIFKGNSRTRWKGRKVCDKDDRWILRSELQERDGVRNVSRGCD